MCPPPAPKDGEGGGGSIFWKTPDIGLTSYSIISLRRMVCTEYQVASTIKHKPIPAFPVPTPTLPTLFQRQSANDKHGHTNNVDNFPTRLSIISLTGGFLPFLCMYFIQHCFIYRPSDSAASEDAGIVPRTVATSALAVRRPLATRLHPILYFVSPMVSL